MKAPMLEERGEPSRVCKVIGALAKTIPFLAVDEIDPGSDLAESRRVEDVVGRFHRNGLNELDSLQRNHLCYGNEYNSDRALRQRELGAPYRGSRRCSLVNGCP